MHSKEDELAELETQMQLKMDEKDKCIQDLKVELKQLGDKLQEAMKARERHECEKQEHEEAIDGLKKKVT